MIDHVFEIYLRILLLKIKKIGRRPYIHFLIQFVIFKLLSYCFEETIGFDVLSRLQVVQYRG